MALISRIRDALAWRMTRLRGHIIMARARLHRRRMRNTTFVGITGSAGKTTTKDLALAVLARGGQVSGNAASLNYLIDLANAILTTKLSDQFSVLEIAINAPGSIDAKIELARPSIAALTVVQRDHIKNFDSVEDIAAEKGKLILSLPPDGTAVLNMDDPLVRAIGEQARAKRIWFGRAAESDIRLIEATSSYPDPLTLVIEYQGTQYRCATGLHGVYLVVPVLAAIGIGIAAGVPIQECIDALADAETTPGRMQIAPSTGGVTFLRDDYKAPHWAFPATMDYMSAARAKRKVAVIGTLSDYSGSASKRYPQVARQAMAVADLVVFVGPHALRALKARRNDEDQTLFGFTEIEEANKFLQRELRDGDLVLLKGSVRADHLVRLYLARSSPVTCWVNGCGLNRFCNVCPRVSKPVPVKAQLPGSTSGLPVGVATATAVSTAVESSATAPTASGVWLVVGMGNHGEAYADTPHNVGFAAVDLLARQLHLDWQEEPEGKLSYGDVDGHKVILFKSATLINVCGPAVESVRRRLGISADRVIIVHDDSDLPLGDARIKQKGSDGGHKGLRSVFLALGNEGFMPRVRIGVRPPQVADIAAKSLVLQHFDSADAAALTAGLERAVSRLHTCITGVQQGQRKAQMERLSEAPISTGTETS